MIEKLNTYEEKRSKKNPLLSESGRVGARNTELLKGTLEYDKRSADEHIGSRVEPIIIRPYVY